MQIIAHRDHYRQSDGFVQFSAVQKKSAAVLLLSVILLGLVGVLVVYMFVRLHVKEKLTKSCFGVEDKLLPRRMYRPSKFEY